MQLPINADTLSRAGEGEPLQIEGVVSNTRCERVAGAVIRFHQANGQGEYGPPDAGDVRCCYLQGAVITDEAGRFRVQTVRPGAYQGNPAHIHLQVFQPDYRTLETEIHFGGASAAIDRGDGIIAQEVRTGSLTHAIIVIVLSG